MQNLSMRSLHRAFLALSIAVTLVGCDGHMAVLSVHDRSSPPAPLLLSVVQNESNSDVPKVVAEVAHSLDMAAIDDRPNYYVKKLPNGFGFAMHVDWSDHQHVWNISLLDWPTLQRSDMSRQAENMLRARLAGIRAPD
jgi:hypothetical protein